MEVLIRQERLEDFKIVEQVVETAFKEEAMSDQTEHLLVARLRKTNAFIPQLSLVAVFEGQIVGHILLSKISINKEQNKIESLALAPVSILPDFQRKGIGSALIKRSHQIARDLGFNSIILVGHEAYYPRFGYEPTSKFGITFPFDVPEENGMVIELKKDTLKNIKGVVEYAPAFFE